jgi:hypothetical protein
LAHITSPAQRVKKAPSRRPRPLKGTPSSPRWPLRVFDPPLSPRWSDLTIENSTPQPGCTGEDEMISVGNKKHGARGIYVGRPSPLGNPFPLYREAERGAVIRDYEDWLAEQLLDPLSAASIEMRRLAALARKQDLCLVCWCAPKACHAAIIKRTIEAINRE